MVAATVTMKPALGSEPSGQIVPIRSEADVVLVRHAVREWTTRLGFRLINQTKLVTAASEIARNTLIYGGGGACGLSRVVDGSKEGLRLRFEDKGPGIADLALAMKDGFTTGSGLGMGLPGTKRLVDQFEIESTVGEGTIVTITSWKQ